MSSSTFKMVELSATSSLPHENLTFKWTIKNFKDLIDTAFRAAESDMAVVTTHSFELGNTLFFPELCKVKMMLKIKIGKNGANGVTQIFMCLERVSPVTKTIFAKMSVTIHKDSLFTDRLRSLICPRLKNYTQQRTWNLGKIAELSKIDTMLDSEGSCNIHLQADFFLYTDDVATIDVVEENANPAIQGNYVKSGNEIILKQMISILGDEGTSDVVIIVLDRISQVEIGRFYCHSVILSGRSAILRESLANCEKMEMNKRILTMNNVAMDAVEQFLTFLYSGKLKEAEINDARRYFSAEPIWVERLPQLATMAYQYGIEDLLEICDIHLHRAATCEASVAEILRIAKRCNFSKTLAKLQERFSEDPELLYRAIWY